MSFVKTESKETVLIVAIRIEHLVEDLRIQEVAMEMYAAADKCREKKVLFDLTHVHVLSSAALGVVIKAQRKCAKRGIWLKFAGCPEPLREVLTMGRLGRRVDFHRDVPEAIAAFQGQPPADRAPGPDDGPGDAGVFVPLKPRPSGGSTARDKENPPIVTAKNELYLKHPAPRVAPWVVIQHVGPKLELREVQGIGRQSDVGENIRARWLAPS